jgi:hypothetical protein
MGSQQHALGNHCGLVRMCWCGWSGSDDDDDDGVTTYYVLFELVVVDNDHSFQIRMVRGMNPRYLHLDFGQTEEISPFNTTFLTFYSVQTEFGFQNLNADFPELHLHA